jgi:PAS domain S-box-containing protein
MKKNVIDLDTPILYHEKQNNQKQKNDLHNSYSFQLLAEEFPNSYLMVVEADLTISYISGREIKKNKINPNDYIGKTLADWFDPRGPEIHKLVANSFAGKTSDWDTLFRGEYFHIRIIPVKTGKYIKKVIVIAENVNEKKQAQKALEKRILALTRPIDDVFYVTFEDLINLHDIQNLQDQFADAFNVASLITKPDGTPITKPSNFSNLCTEFIRPSPIGIKNCKLSDAVLGRQNSTGPIIQPCLSAGLCDAGASITVGGRHIANWLIGQVRTEEQSEDKIRAYARQLNVDEEAMCTAYKKLPEMSKKKFEQIAEFLFLLAQQLSTLAYQNIQQARFISERKQAEEALANSEDRYKSYIRHSPYGIIISGRSGQLLDFNPMISKMTGFTDEELKEYAISQLFLPDEAREIRQRINRVFQSGYGTIESRIRRKDGAIRWWEGKIVKLSEKSMLAFVTDMTDQKTANEELAKKNQELNNFFDSAIDLISIVDKEGYFRRINPEWENALGYKEEELINTKYIDYVHPDDIEATRQEGNRLKKNKTEINFINRYRHKDGTYRWIEWRSSQLNDMLYATARDITGRIEAEKEIKMNLGKFQALFNNMIEGCAIHEIIIDDMGKPINYRILDANPSFEKILGLSLKEIAGKLATEVYGTDTAPYLEEFAKVGLTGIPARMKTFFPPMDKHFEISISCPGQNQFVTIFSDITQRIKNEEQINLLNLTLEQKVVERTQQLELANKELEAFTYSVSHDLRAPLRSIDGFSQILLEDLFETLPDDGKHYLEQVRTSTQQMGKLIDDLLRLSRIMRTDLHITRVNLSQISQNIVDNIRRIEPDRKVQVNIQPEIMLLCDHNLIQICMENLIRNAWKFTGKTTKAKIEIKCQNGKEYTTCSIQDNGAGFDMTYASKLFGAFQRLHSEDEFEGTGIGLAIVQRIIQKHGGTIWTEGKVGQGATFWFTIPTGGER